MNTERERLLDEVVTAYMKAVEAGDAPNRDEFLARHPDLAADLAAFFAAESQVNRVAAPLRRFDGEAPTIGLVESEPAGPGTKIEYVGDYQLLEEVGRGGMGVVYKARQETLNRTVALKMILTGQLATEADVKRFRAEAEAAAKLDHPGIVPVFEVGQYEGHHYFSMAFVEGESLAHRLAQGLSAPREAAELTRKVAEAVAYAHVEGVIHRDLKPGNILIDKNGQPRLTDFGLAKRIHGDVGRIGNPSYDLTATGQIVGTPSYMPPEQASGKRDVGPLADVYSLGAVLYCLLTGRPPFQADNPLDTLMQVLQRDPVAPRQLNAAIPRDLETICLKCLEKEPRKRYASARELAADLDRFLGGQPIHARPVGSFEKSWRWCRRNPVVAGLAASLLLVLVSGTLTSAVLAVQARTEERRAQHEAAVSAGLTVQANEFAAEKSSLADRISSQERLTRRYLYAAHMNLANEAWKNGNVLRVQELLNQHRPGAEPEDLTSFDWGYLWQQCNRQRKTIALVKGENVGTISVSPNGRWIALGITGSYISARGEDETFGEIRLWDVDAGMLRHTVHGTLNPDDKNPERQFQEPVFSLDGKLFAVVVFDFHMVQHPWGGQRERSAPRITIWDLETLKARATIPLPSFQLMDRIAISPDNKRVAAGFSTRPSKELNQVHTISVWDLPERDNAPIAEPVLTRKLENKDIADAGFPCFAFSADGKSLLWGRAQDNNLTVTDVSGGGKDASWPFYGQRLTVSPAGKYLANRWGHTAVKLHEARTGKDLHVFPADAALIYAGAKTCFSPDDRLLAITQGLTLDLWDVATKKQVGEVRGHNDYIRAVAFGEDGKTVVTVANNKATGNLEAKVWDVAIRPGPDEFTLAGRAPNRFHPAYGRDIAYTFYNSNVALDGKTLATLWKSPDFELSSLILYDISSGSLGKQLVDLKWDDLPSQFKPVYVSTSRDGKWLALSGEGIHPANNRQPHLQLWQLAPGPTGTKATLARTIFAPQSDSSRQALAVFAPEGTKLAYADCTWKWSHDKKTGATTTGPDCLQLHDLASHNVTQLPADPAAWFAYAPGLQSGHYSDWRGSCNGIVFSSDGKRIFTVHKTYVMPWVTRIIAWDAATGEVLSVLESPTPLGYFVQPFALSQDDSTLATCQDDHSIFLWDVSESTLREVHDELKRRAEDPNQKPKEPAGKPKVRLRGHAGNITALAFHPDGKTLASSSSDRTIKIWDIATGELRLSLEAHAANVLRFTPDGKTLISADIRGEVKLWRAATGELTAE